jgi:hypothetical protein
MSCGVSSSCGRFSAGCGSFVRSCGYSSISPQNSITPTKPSTKEKTLSTKEIFVYDMSNSFNNFFCFVREIKDNKVVTYQQKMNLDQLIRLKKHTNFDTCSFVGISLKKDGSFELRPKTLKPFEQMLELNVSNFKNHYNHMVRVRDFLKSESLEENKDNSSEMER